MAEPPVPEFFFKPGKLSPMSRKIFLSSWQVCHCWAHIFLDAFLSGFIAVVSVRGTVDSLIAAYFHGGHKYKTIIQLFPCVRRSRLRVVHEAA